MLAAARSSFQTMLDLNAESVQTTEKYLGCKQRLQNAVNDRIGIEPSH